MNFSELILSLSSLPSGNTFRQHILSITTKSKVIIKGETIMTLEDEEQQVLVDDTNMTLVIEEDSVKTNIEGENEWISSQETIGLYL